MSADMRDDLSTIVGSTRRRQRCSTGRGQGRRRRRGRRGSHRRLPAPLLPPRRDRGPRPPRAPRTSSARRRRHRELARHRPQGTATVRVTSPTAERDGWTARAHRRRGRHRRHAVPRRLGHRRAQPARPGDPPRGAPAARRPARRHRHAARGVRRRRGASATTTDDAASSRGCTSRSTASTDDAGDEALDRRPRAGAARRPRGGRGLAEDARHRAAHRRRARRQPPARAARPGGRRGDRAACGGSPTTTSPSWATASTPSTTAPSRVRRRPTGRERLVAVAGTGLGILRADQPQSARRRPAAARGRDRGPGAPAAASSPRPTPARRCTARPTSTTSASRRSTSSGEVIGERRFLGLFTSAAYNESIQRDPGAAPQGDRGALGRAGSPRQPLRQGPAADPRDLPARRAVPDLRRRPAPIALAVLHLQERRQVRLFLRRDDYGRFMSCLVYLPRDRYTTQVRLAMEEILLDAFDGVSVDYTALVSESVLARLHFVVRVDPGRGVPDVDPAELEGRLVRATRTWDDDFADALRGQLRRGAGVDRWQRSTATRSPRPTRRTSRPPTAVADLHRLEALRATAPSTWRCTLPRDAAPGRPPVQAVPRRRTGLAVPGAAPAAADGRRGRRRAAVRDRPGRPPRRVRLRLRPALRAVGRRRLGRRADPLPGRVRGRLGRRGGERRVQRAGAAGRADLAPGGGAARLREVPAPGRVDVQPGLHRGVPDLERPHRAAAGRGCSRRALDPAFDDRRRTR